METGKFSYWTPVLDDVCRFSTEKMRGGGNHEEHRICDIHEPDCSLHVHAVVESKLCFTRKVTALANWLDWSLILFA